MSEDNVMGADFPQDREARRQRAAFWMSAFMSNVKRNMVLGFEPGPELELAREMMRSYIVFGFENADFRPDDLGSLTPEQIFPGVSPGEAHNLFDEMEGNIPMSIAVEICAGIEIDAVEILHEYVNRSTRNLTYASTLLRPYAPDVTPDFFVQRPFDYAQGKPASEGPHVFQVPLGQLSPEEADRIFKEHFADAYILHVLHGARPCRHPYESLDEAIEGAAEDELDGTITAALHITHQGQAVMDDDDLRQRIDRIKAAGLN